MHKMKDDFVRIVRPFLEDNVKEQKEFIPGKSRIALSRPTFGVDEVVEAVDSLVSMDLTMGEKVNQFESHWADDTGTEFAHMVNSGSSANLLALKALEGDVIQPGDEVIVPAVAWSTSLFPILDVGATPVLVDVGLDSYTVDVNAFREAITEDTAATVFVHLLGNPCDMGPLLEICGENDIAIVEDCCEAHGAAYDGQKVGSFGDLGTFSYFFSHHISTIEGGMVVTDDQQLSERVRMSRAHGWVRELDNVEQYAEQFPEIDDRYLFMSTGYNLRPTEIQGAFGIHQLPKLDGFVEKRRDNAAYLNERLDRYDEYFHLFEESSPGYCSWFAYPFLLSENAPFTRREFQNFLEANNIETRPILAGNLARQPVLDSIDHRIAGELAAAQHIHENGLFIGNHHRLTDEKLEYVVDTVTEFVASNT